MELLVSVWGTYVVNLTRFLKLSETNEFRDQLTSRKLEIHIIRKADNKSTVIKESIPYFSLYYKLFRIIVETLNHGHI